MTPKREFWIMAVSLVLCAVVAMVLIIVGVSTGDTDHIPPRTRDDGTLEPPPGYTTA